MSKKSKKNYPQEFRDKAVRLVNECGYGIDQVAEQLGCSKEPVDITKEKKDVTEKDLSRAVIKLAKFARCHNIKLRQSYTRKAKQAARKASGYAAAKQFNRLKTGKSVFKLEKKIPFTLTF